jgi:hypothetical protein
MGEKISGRFYVNVGIYCTGYLIFHACVNQERRCTHISEYLQEHQRQLRAAFSTECPSFHGADARHAHAAGILRRGKP